MEQIKKELITLSNQQEELTNEQIMTVFFKIGALGDVFLLKNDGLRIDNVFTVVITGRGTFEPIRLDGDNLSQVIKEALCKYIKY